MKLVSVSRRTDIPAFYAKWFLNRIEAGFCEWVNPFGGQVYRVSLRPEDCLGLVFWTRYPAPLLPHLDELKARGFAFYFHFTINGYGPRLETHNPDPVKALDVFRSLSDRISPALTLWRYDPILFSDQTPAEYHIGQFASLARALRGATERCYFSFVDAYGKTRRNLRAHNIPYSEPGGKEKLALVRRMRDIAAGEGITLYSCCEDAMVGEGVEKAHCVELELLRRMRPDLTQRLKAAPTRAECGCVESVDIGAYDTCRFGCVYCYATNSREAAERRAHSHDPAGSALWRPEPALRPGADGP